MFGFDIDGKMFKNASKQFVIHIWYSVFIIFFRIPKKGHIKYSRQNEVLKLKKKKKSDYKQLQNFRKISKIESNLHFGYLKRKLRIIWEKFRNSPRNRLSEIKLHFLQRFSSEN